MEEKSEMIFVENGKSKKRILITLGVILLLVVGIFVYIKLYYSASSFLTKTAKNLTSFVDDAYEKVNLNEDYINNMDKYDIKENIKLGIDTNILSGAENLELILNENMSVKNNYLNLDLNVNQDDANLNAEITYKDNKMYLESKDILDKPIYLSDAENENIDFNSLVSQYQEILKVSNKKTINKLIKYLEKALNESKMTTKLKGLTEEYSYEVNETNKDKVVDKFINLIKEDEELSKSLEINDDTVSDIKSNISNIKVLVEVQLFTNKIKTLKVNANDYVIEGKLVSKDKYKFTDGENDYEIEIKDDEVLLETYNNDKRLNTVKITNNDDEFKLIVTSSDVELNMNLKNTNKNNSVLEVILNSDKINLNVNLNIDNNASDKKVNANGKINVTYDTYKVNLTLDSNLEYGENIVNIKEINDAKDYNSLTENDTNGYSTKIMNKLSKFKLYNSILSLVSNFMQ